MTQAYSAAVIDIGSNSVRLVVYGGSPRAPSVDFNEKVLAGLGRKVESTGLMSEKAQARALQALARFKALLRHMNVRNVRVVATAAVREAANGPQFVSKVEALGFHCEVLSATHEAELAGFGVLSAIPDAAGIAADLGGGSLELTEVRDGTIGTAISLPFGVFRVDPPDGKRLADILRSRADETGLRAAGKDRSLYLVGGSWRTLARLDIRTVHYPLTVTHEYVMDPARAEALVDIVAGHGEQGLRDLPEVSSGRAATLGSAAMILAALTRAIKPSRLIVCNHGIREGLLYTQLQPADRRRDPLIDAALHAAFEARPFDAHGDLLNQWMEPLFDDPPTLVRLRRMACILADSTWQAHPVFRAGRGVEMALHGAWTGIDSPSRVLVAQALHTAFGGPGLVGGSNLRALCPPTQVERARHWGLAIRLAQRLSGGNARALSASRLATDDDGLHLIFEDKDRLLAGEVVERRLARLAAAMGMDPRPPNGRH